MTISTLWEILSPETGHYQGRNYVQMRLGQMSRHKEELIKNSCNENQCQNNLIVRKVNLKIRSIDALFQFGQNGTVKKKEGK